MEEGSNLSQGQRQLLHLTRSLLRKAPIVLLDEVTAYLDEASEKIYFDSLLFHAKESTIIIISHKPKSVSSFCDKFLLLSNGSGTLSVATT